VRVSCLLSWVHAILEDPPDPLTERACVMASRSMSLQGGEMCCTYLPTYLGLVGVEGIKRPLESHLVAAQAVHGVGDHEGGGLRPLQPAP
jgi:hypothetical protein